MPPCRLQYLGRVQAIARPAPQQVESTGLALVSGLSWACQGRWLIAALLPTDANCRLPRQQHPSSQTTASGDEAGAKFNSTSKSLARRV